MSGLILDLDTGSSKQCSKIKKIVLNIGTGGFKLSKEAGEWIHQNASEDLKYKADKLLSNHYRIFKTASDYAYAYSILFGTLSERKRSNPLLIKCVEFLGEKASYKSKDSWYNIFNNKKLSSKLIIVNFNDDKFIIDVNSDGVEELKTPTSIEWEKWEDWENETKVMEYVPLINKENINKTKTTEKKGNFKYE